ncbi:hypothetical protein PENSPDRAFT_691249 [Peniophora sp. CONT]|nr:hypothetical protein PENSPDRAFT_691249 [Peniophora sp. CONT]
MAGSGQELQLPRVQVSAGAGAGLLTQSELINGRLQEEEVIAQGIGLRRCWEPEVCMRVERERGGHLAKLDELATGIKKLEAAAHANLSHLDENLRLHAIGPPSVHWA